MKYLRPNITITISFTHHMMKQNISASRCLNTNLENMDNKIENAIY